MTHHNSLTLSTLMYVVLVCSCIFNHLMRIHFKNGIYNFPTWHLAEKG